MVVIPTQPTATEPAITYLANTWQNYGLSKSQYVKIRDSYFNNRYDFDAQIQGRPDFIWVHTQDGVTRGSLQHWARPDVEASSTVMIQRDGSILKVIPEQHGPWTNGDVKNPTAEAGEILALGGNPNIWVLTAEFEDNGDPTLELTPAQLNAGLWQFQTWCITYPHILEHTISFGRHRYLNTIDKYRCPDPFQDGSNQGKFNNLLAGMNDWLNTVTPIVTYPKPDTTLAAKLVGKHALSISGAIVVHFSDWVQFEKPITPHVYADKGSKPLGPNVTDKIQVIAIIEKGNGEKWFLSKDNARYLITGNKLTVL